MARVGKSFVFDYGALAVRVKYLSETRLEWEQTKGPNPGRKAEEEYGAAAIWISPEKELSAFQGKVPPVPR